ncbi:EAL domain-containing protein [Thalassospira lucentensis]|uniref:EAL domain-containing protein n=1 Tax=Thalassospira lucentensis TaxID=168935 RepID=UPI00142E4104|nr:EAL domain-containing protein [Thalassospira lucentensis]NIZ00248.1 EAL domain-containing protein [Thalassospira lucentensis]
MIRPTSDDGPNSGRTVGTLSPGKVLTCAPDLPLGKAIAHMRKSNCSSIVVVSSHKPIGIITEKDVLSLPADSHSALNAPIENHMSKPVHTISVHASQQAAIVRMRDLNVRHLATVDEQNHLAGIISQTDLIRQVAVSKSLNSNDVETAVRRSTLFVDAGISVSDLRLKMHSEKCDNAIVTGFDRDLPAAEQTGIITERDILRYLVDGNEHQSAGDIATRPVTMVNHAINLNDARDIMMRANIRHLVVHNRHKEVIGVLSFADLLHFIEQDYFAQLRSLNEDNNSDVANAKRSLLLAHKLIETSPDCVMVCNARGDIEAVNPAFTRVTGYQAEEVIGKNPRILQSGRQNKAFYDAMWGEVMRTGNWEGEIWNRRKSGEIYPEWLSIMAIRDSDGITSHYAAIFTDISGREKNRENIRRLAHTDELTGMPNRRRFAELLSHHIGRARQQGTRLTVIMLDIDNFQRVNSALSHNDGDDVLIEVGRRITRELGQDAVVARVGADEYAAILPDVQTDHDARKASDTLLGRLREPYMTRKGTELYLSASIGIACFPEDAHDTSMLLRNAELAMMEAKEEGRNRALKYRQALESQNGAELELETAFRQALDNQELHLVYQPQFDARTQELCGVEALARWTRPDGTVIPPSTFIPMAENIGAIDDLGRWVMRTACRQLINWRAEGLLNLRVAINVSVQQFYGAVDFAEQLRTILLDKGIAADRLEIEVTESLFMRNIDDMRIKLQRVRDLGVNISLDDFGTGFSNLSYLRTLPFDTLKLDRSFVIDIDNGEDGQALALSILKMAQNLGKTCVAEGVENHHQLAFLRNAGCDLIQGYLLGKPMPADDITAIAKQQQSLAI